MTGKYELSFEKAGVNVVGGVELKTAAAARDGFRLMVMPKENVERI